MSASFLEDPQGVIAEDVAGDVAQRALEAGDARFGTGGEDTGDA